MGQPKSLRYELSWPLRAQPTSWQRWVETGALAKDGGELICHLALGTALPCSVTQLRLPLRFSFSCKVFVPRLALMFTYNTVYNKAFAAHETCGTAGGWEGVPYVFTRRYSLFSCGVADILGQIHT